MAPNSFGEGGTLTCAGGTVTYPAPIFVAKSSASTKMDNGLPTRHDAFPAGLRVLVVDDDPTWLKILEKMLKKCSYEVTTCGLARDALNLLRERKDGFDIVISDVNMPDMDGFKLLEHVGLEMDLPVIMMSVDGETSRVMKGVQHGACDYLLKPIRMKELRNIWQHVFRKKIHEVREIEGHDGFEGIHITRNGFEYSDDVRLFSGEDLSLARKRKDLDTKHDDKDYGDSSSTKKARVVWTVDLHQKFVKAVNQIGFDKVGPKKILDLMKVPWLTRENVASHLQKYRLYLSRLQKENDERFSSCGMKHSDLPPNDPTGSYGLQNSMNIQQSGIIGDSSRYHGCRLQQTLDAKNHEGGLKGIISECMTEPKKALNGNISDPLIRSSQVSFNHSYANLEPEGKSSSFDCSIPSQYSWTEAPEIQLKQEQKPLLQTEVGFGPLPFHNTRHSNQLDQQQSVPSISSASSVTEREMSGSVESEPLYSDYKRDKASDMSLNGRAVENFTVQPKSQMVNHQSLEPISSATSGIKKEGLNINGLSDVEYWQRNLLLENYATMPLDEDLQFCWLQGDYNNMNLALQNVEFSGYSDPGLFPEVPVHLYDGLKFEHDYSHDTADYPLIGQGLFIA